MPSPLPPLSFLDIISLLRSSSVPLPPPAEFWYTGTGGMCQCGLVLPIVGFHVVISGSVLSVTYEHYRQVTGNLVAENFVVEIVIAWNNIGATPASGPP